MNLIHAIETAKNSNDAKGRSSAHTPRVAKLVADLKQPRSRRLRTARACRRFRRSPAALAFIAAFGFLTASIFAQVAVPSAGNTPIAAVVETGPDYRVWESLDPARAAAPGDGRMVEIATGMNYWNGTNWSESVPAFQPRVQAAAFVADQVQHRAKVSGDINIEGAISLSTPDGQMLSSTPIGIGLYDAASGQSMLLATVTNTLEAIS